MKTEPNGGYEINCSFSHLAPWWQEEHQLRPCLCWGAKVMWADTAWFGTGFTRSHRDEALSTERKSALHPRTPPHPPLSNPDVISAGAVIQCNRWKDGRPTFELRNPRSVEQVLITLQCSPFIKWPWSQSFLHFLFHFPKWSPKLIVSGPAYPQVFVFAPLLWHHVLY